MPLTPAARATFMAADPIGLIFQLHVTLELHREPMGYTSSSAGAAALKRLLFVAPNQAYGNRTKQSGEVAHAHIGQVPRCGAYSCDRCRTFSAFLPGSADLGAA